MLISRPPAHQERVQCRLDDPGCAPYVRGYRAAHLCRGAPAVQVPAQAGGLYVTEFWPDSLARLKQAVESADDG